MDHFEDLDVLSSLGQWFSSHSIRLRDGRLNSAATLASQPAASHCLSFIITVGIMTLGWGLFVGLAAESRSQIWFPCLNEKNSMSQSLWQIGRPDLNAFFPSSSSFFFFFFFPEQQMCQIWVGHNWVQYEIWNLIYGWTTWYKTEHRVEEVCCIKWFIVSVLCLFIYILTNNFKKWKRIKQAKKKKLKAWILLNQTCTEKQTCAAALRHEIIFLKPKHFMRIALWVVHLVCM